MACRAPSATSALLEAADGLVRCPACEHGLNWIRPNVDFIGDTSSASEIEAYVRADLLQVDMLVVLGATLAAEPLRSLPASLARDVPQIFIGDTPPAALTDHPWGLELIGDCRRHRRGRRRRGSRGRKEAE